MNTIIECGDKLYYDINPDSKMDVPSFFYEALEEDYKIWIEGPPTKPFYEWCKNKIIL